MAPEQRRDPRAVRPATDVYALAVTLAWILTGRAPGDLFAPEAAAELVEAGVPVATAQLLVRAGAYDAAARLADAGQLGAELDGFLGGGVSEAGRAWLTEAARGEVAGGEGSDVGFGGGGPRPPATPPGTGLRNAGLVVAGLLAGLGGAFAWTARRAEAPPVPVTSDETPESRTDAPPSSAPADLPACDDGVKSLLPIVRPGPEETVAAAAFDIDGDGFGDAVFTNQLAESLTIWWGKAGGVLVPANRQEIAAGRSASSALLHAEGSVRQLLLPKADASRIARWSVQGRVLTPLPDIQQPGSPSAAVLVHWDDDDALDLLVNTEPCLMWRKGDGSGAFPVGACVEMGGRTIARAAIALVGRTLAVLQRDRKLGVFDGGADGAPRSRETLPFFGGLPFPAALPLPRGAAFFVTEEHGTTLGRWTRAAAAPLSAPTAWSSCQWARGQIDGRRLHAVGDLDGDGSPELLGSITCSGCTSNQIGWTAEP
jgi:hypothetical protein